MFYNNSTDASLYDINVSFPTLQSVTGVRCMTNMFYNQKSNRQIKVNFPELTSIHGSECCRSMFSNITGSYSV